MRAPHRCSTQSKGSFTMHRRTKMAVAASTALLLLAACGNSASNNAANSSAAGGAGSSPATAASAPSAIAAPSGASTAGGGPTKNPATDGQSINVLMVNNPQMIDMQSLTEANYTAQTGITVNYTVLPENDMRNKASLEFKNQAGQYDVSTLSNFEIPFYAKNGWLTSLQDYATKDVAFNQADIFPALTASLSSDNQIYGEPFYGE